MFWRWCWSVDRQLGDVVEDKGEGVVSRVTFKKRMVRSRAKVVCLFKEKKSGKTEDENSVFFNISQRP